MLKNIIAASKKLLGGNSFGSEFMVMQTDPAELERFLVEVAESDRPVIVEFWAPGCEPCKIMHPIVDEVRTHFAGRIKLIQVNIEQNFSIPMHYNIDCFPALLIFVQGKLVDQIVGTVPQIVLMKVIAKHLTSLSTC